MPSHEAHLDVAGSVLFLAVVALIGLYDVIALTTGGTWPTVSERIFDWSQRYPLMPLFVGILLGHLFFPLRATSKP